MYRPYFLFALSLSLASLSADEGSGEAPLFVPIESQSLESAESAALPTLTSFPTEQKEETISLETPLPAIQTPVVEAPPAPKKIAEKPLDPFTGKIKGKKVRLRANADLESRVIKELSKDDYLLIVGEKGDFYAVEPPEGIKAYVFRSFILDGIVEGTKVNVRLAPSLDAPIIGHLNAGDHVKDSVISAINNKWLEISPPAETHFYVAKAYIERCGGPEVKERFEKERTAAVKLLESANLFSQAELEKSFHEIDLEQIKGQYERVIGEYGEFTDLTEKAREALASVQEEYLHKRLSYVKEHPESALRQAQENIAQAEKNLNPTDTMKLWEPVEESLYLSWAQRNDDRPIQEFYAEEKKNGTTITGIVEPYTSPVKKKPGNFILRNQELPVGYLYSTHINLQEYVGKKVTVVAVPRPNNNFAFPAYYVLAVE